MKMGPVPEGADRILSSGTGESASPIPLMSSFDSRQAAAAAEVSDLLHNLKVEPQSEYSEVSPSQDGNVSDSSGDASASSDYVNHAGNGNGNANGHEVNPESGIFYSTNGYATHAAYAYDYTQAGTGTDWEEFPRYVGLNGLDTSMYAEAGTVVYQTGYGYAQQPYGAYAPYYGADGQLYGHPYVYQGQYPVMDAEASKVEDGGKTGPRPGYPVTFMAPYGYYPRGLVPVQTTQQDGRVFEGLRASAPAWVDTRSSDNQKAQPQKPQAHQQSEEAPAPPASPGALGTAFPPLTRAALSVSGKAGRVQNGSSVELSGGKPEGGDSLSEQNRGPRTSKPRFQRFFPGGLRPHKGDECPEETPDSEIVVAREDYNKPDFPTYYKEAKFYIIKSYSEDDVHKSIKYGVWASTPNGNRRLNAAYQDAQVKQCPIFLLFSVNASGQFCGVAEMTGPVDFVKSLDFWQQDKWSGRFTVKWHIIKDIPNGHFRHIILENNDNKPVTNSRDTQEVHLGQGMELLKIFKNFPCHTSILDDFQYYETRQKAMQEKRSRQSQKQQQQDAGGIIYMDASKSNVSGTEKPTDNATGTTAGKEDASLVVVPKKSYLRSLAGEKDAASNVVDVKAG